MNKSINLISTGITIFVFLLSVFQVSADLIDPTYFTKHCKPGEKEITCSYKSEKPFGPLTYDECIKFSNNPNYYALTGHRSSFGGESKYCLKLNAEDNGTEVLLKKNIYLGIVILIITLVSLVALTIIRKRKTK
jgi:hypothetical protein